LHHRPTYTSTLSLHDALPISYLFLPKAGGRAARGPGWSHFSRWIWPSRGTAFSSPLTAEMKPITAQIKQKMPHSQPMQGIKLSRDRKSTRLNSSHVSISYAVC